MVVVVLLGFGVAACGTVDSPRWSPAQAIDDVEADTFASPRTVFVVASDPGDAAVELRGRVRASRFTEVLAPSDGVLLKLVVERGDLVEEGQVIVEGETAPTAAQLIALQILELRAELSLASDSPPDEVAAAEQAIENARAELAPVPFTIEATTSGIVGLPPGSDRVLEEGEPVVLIADPESLVVEVQVLPGEGDGLQVGAAVTIAAASGANTQTESGRIERIIEPDDPTEATILSIPIKGDVLTLGDAIFAVVDIAPTPGAAWLPAAAVDRRDGASFVLIPDGISNSAGSGDDGLRRVPVVLGRRAGDMVELLEGPTAGTTVVGP